MTLRQHAVKDARRGFTIVEVIFTVLILGIIGAVGVVGFSDAVRGYLFAVDNAEVAQKAQNAMARLNLELMHIREVTASSAVSISYTADFDAIPGSQSTGNTIDYDAASNVVTYNNQVLIDGVQDFTLNFLDSHDDTSNSTSWDENSTQLIHCAMTVRGLNDVDQFFQTRVHRSIFNPDINPITD